MSSVLVKFARQTRSKQKWVIGAIVATPVVAGMQGAFYLAKYRSNHGNAPFPASPSRGLVVVSPRDIDDDDDEEAADRSSSQLTAEKAPSIGKARNKRRSSRRKRLVNTKVAHEPPLRLLVIGDSLAAGVGTCRSATPLLPEAIARSLSKALGGRAVYWTCHGKPGASAWQIMNDMEHFHHEELISLTMAAAINDNHQPGTEPHDALGTTDLPFVLRLVVEQWRGAVMRARHFFHNRKRPQISNADTEVNDSTTEPLRGSDHDKKPWWQSLHVEEAKDFIATVFKKDNNTSAPTYSSDDEEVEDGEQRAWRRWRARLIDMNGDQLNPERSGYYDIVVVLTGLNDVKALFLPFMMKNNDDRGDGRGFGEGLKMLFQSLKNKMKLKIQQQRTTTTPKHVDPFSRSDDTEDDRLDSRRAHRIFETQNSELKSRPLIVLPALPLETTPILRIPPLSWLGYPLFQMIDDLKRSLSNEYPGAVLFVESPSIQSIQDIEAGRGPLFTMRQSENVLLLLKDVTIRNRSTIERNMEEHYPRVVERNVDLMIGEDEEEVEQEKHFEQAFHQHSFATTTTVRMPNKQIVSKLMSIDNVHPNDDGYNYWGRHIAMAIVQEWKQQQ